MADVEATRTRVQRYLTDEFGPITIDGEGDFSVQHESTRAFARVLEWGENTVVSVFAPILFDVQASPALYEYVALKGSDFIFGHIDLFQESDGTLALHFRNTLLGDFLDPDELVSTVVGVAVTANQLDDELQGRFGGKRLIDL